MPVPDFSPGEVLTAAAMDSIGLWLVKTVTVGSGVTQIPVTDAFSASYDHYKIVYIGGVATGQDDLLMQLGSTTSGYAHSVITTNWSSSPSLIIAGDSNASSWARAGLVEPDNCYLNLEISNPFNAKRTIAWGSFVGSDTSRVGGSFSGFLADTTSYTDFTIFIGGGFSVTGGTVYVYGYRK